MSSSSTISSLTTGTITNTTVDLVWSGTYNTVSVQQSQDNITYSTVATDITDASYTVTGLTTNTLYYFVVTAYDISGSEGTSKSTFATTDYNVEITSFYAGTPTTTTIPLFWSGSYYKVDLYYRINGIGSDFVYYETITGKPSYTITSLVEDTSYDFQLIPYNIGDEAGTISDIVTTSTDYVPYITTFSLARTAATTATLQWTGKFSYITIQKSINNVNFATDTRMITGTSSISTDGSFAVTGLSPYYDYFFRIIPYSYCYNPGTITTSVHGKTLMGISEFYNETPTPTSVKLHWSGIYTRLKIYKVVNNNIITIADISNSTVATTVGTYTAIGLNPNTDYSFYLQPYNGIVKTTLSDTISTITDFSAQVNIVVRETDLSSVAIPLIFDTTGVISPYYETALVQLSSNDEASYVDVSLITQKTMVTNKYVYTIPGLSADTRYRVHVLPYSLYNVSGENVYKTIATKGYISSASVYLNENNNITLDCSGVYTKTSIQYSTQRNGNAFTEISGVSVYPYTFTNISSNTPYYFRIYPVNQFDISGTPSSQLYNSVITQFYLSEITSSAATAQWSGNYEKVRVQYSTYDEPAVFMDISTCTGSNITFDASSAYTTKYYRLIPYGVDDISGRISSSIYLPVLITINLTNISNYDISMTWTGVYDTVKIQYSTTSSTSGFVDLCTISNAQPVLSTTNTLDINRALLSSLDASKNAYYFRAIPYSVGFGTSTQSVGVTSYSVYNPIIKTISAEIFSGSPTNAITVKYTGTFKYAELFYRRADADYTSEYIEIYNGETSTTVYGLSPHTDYCFKIVPYNDQYTTGVTSQETSMTTKSIIDYINLTYSSPNSTATSIYFYWTNNYYNYIDVYNSSEEFITRVYNTDDPYYNSTAFETLLPDQTYVYTLKIYDDYGSETTTITTYTAASISTLGITPSLYETGVSFTWTNTGYTTISIQNVSTGSDIKTYTDDPNTSTYYDSYSDEAYNGSASKYLLPNTEYDYTFTLTNQQGVSVSETITITTLAQLDFRIVNSSPNLITASSIPIKIGGMFSGANIYIDDGTGVYGNTVTVTDVIPANTLPLSMLYYYPFNEDFYNYSKGYSKEDAMDYNTIAFSTTDKIVGLASLYFNASKSQYLELTAAANSGSGLTIAFWFKSNSSGSGAKVFDFAGNDAISRLYFNVGGSSNSTISYTNSSGSQTLLDLGVSYNDNTWRHIAFVFWENLSKWEVYVNGSKYTTLTGANYPVLTTNYKNYIGKSSSIADNYFNGFIDDFRVYTTSLSFTAIAHLITMGGYDVSLNAATGASLISEANKRYYIKIAGINGAGEASATTTAVQSAKTLGQITSAAIVGCDSSSVFMTWDGSYTSVILESATNATFSANHTSAAYVVSAPIYTKNGLKQNTKYYFRVTPVNQPISDDVSGEHFIVGNTVTLATITSLYVSGGLSNSISLAWDGSFSKVALKQSTNSGQTYSLLPGYYTGKTATISDLSANYTYYYTAVALNSSDVSANTSIVTYGTTLGSLSTIYASDITSTTVSIALSGSYVSSYYADISGGGSAGYDTSSNLTTASPLVVSGLTPNTVYDFRVNAFNNISGTGTAVQKELLGTKTLAYIGTVDLSATSYDTIRVTLKNSYYSSYYLYNGTTYSPLYTSSPVDISGLVGNSVYDITAYAYKTSTGTGTYVSKTSSTTTLAYIENIVATNITPTSFSIGLSTNSQYASYKVKYTGADGSTATTPISTSSPITITGLSSNMVYTIVAYAYNTNIGTGVPTIKTMGNTVTTLGTIASFYTSTAAIDSSSIALYWDGSFSSVILERSSTADFGSAISTRVNSSVGGTYKVYNLAENTKYYYRITPVISQSYYGTDAYGTTVTNDVSGTTLSTITSFAVSSNVSDISASVIKLVWDGSFTYITIQQSTDNFATNVITLPTQYTDKYTYVSGLLSNKTYYYRATSTNSVGVTNPAKTAITSATTRGSITAFYYSTAMDNSSITLYWDGSFASVGLERSTTADFGTGFTSMRISSTGATTYVDANLASNTKYYYKVTPINKPYGSSDVSGITVTNDVSGTTLATMTAFAITSADVSSNSIPLTWDGSFTKIAVYQSTDGTNYVASAGSPFTAKTATITGLAANQLYYFKARPINSNGLYNSFYSGAIPSTTTLAYIKDFSATTINATSIAFKLTDSSYSAFKIGYRKTADSTLAYTGLIISPTSTATIADLSANTSYYFKAYAYNNTAGTGTAVVADINDTVTLPTITGAVINDSTTDLSNTFFKATIYGDYTSFRVTYTKDGVLYTKGYYNYNNTSVLSTYQYKLDGTDTDITLGQIVSYSNTSSYITPLGIYSKYLVCNGLGNYTGASLNTMSPITLPSTGFSISFYIKTSETRNWKRIFDFYNSSTDFIYCALYGGKISIGINNTHYTSFSTTTINDNVWRNVILIVKPSSGNATVDLYIDKVKVVSDYSTVYPTSLTYNYAKLCQSSDNGTGGFVGSLYNFQYFNRVLSSSEVSNIEYASSSSGINTVTISDLSSNTTYYYTVYVNNRTNGAGSDVSAEFSATTLGSTPLFNLATSPATTNTMKFNIYSGEYSKISIKTATDTNMSNVIYTTTISNEDIATVYNNTYIQTDLSENTDYYFNCTPINSLGQYGSPSTTLHATTLGNIYSASVKSYDNITTSSIPVQWTGTYNTLLVEYAPYTNGSIGTYNTFTTKTGNSSSTATTDNTTISNLSSNMRYAFRLTPINNMSYSGAAYVLTDMSAVTLARVLTMTNTALYDTSAAFLVDGSMSSLIVYSSPSSLYKTYSYSVGGISTGTDISGLTADLSYVFYFAAMNSIGVTNPIGLGSNPKDASYSIITWPKIYGVDYIDGSANVIDLSLSGAFTSYDISYSSDSGATYTGAGTRLTSLKPIVTGLTTNTGYKFMIAPYSRNSGLHGYKYITSTMYTDPSISYVTVASTTESTITLNVG